MFLHLILRAPRVRPGVIISRHLDIGRHAGMRGSLTPPGGLIASLPAVESI